jgi:hypothetical protein
MEARQIGVVQGAPSEIVQALLRQFVARLPAGVRAAGVIEDEAPPADSDCNAGELRSLSDGRRFPIMQDLGPAAAGCRLDTEGVVSACEAVLQGIDVGCDLVVLSKFGKVEANRSGLAPAFGRAIEEGLPVLTSVAPKLADAWDTFAAPLYVILPPELTAIEAWWREARPARASADQASAA